MTPPPRRRNISQPQHTDLTLKPSFPHHITPPCCHTHPDFTNKPSCPHHMNQPPPPCRHNQLKIFQPQTDLSLKSSFPHHITHTQPNLPPKPSFSHHTPPPPPCRHIQLYIFQPQPDLSPKPSFPHHITPPQSRHTQLNPETAHDVSDLSDLDFISICQFNCCYKPESSGRDTIDGTSCSCSGQGFDDGVNERGDLSFKKERDLSGVAIRQVFDLGSPLPCVKVDFLKTGVNGEVNGGGSCSSSLHSNSQILTNFNPVPPTPTPNDDDLDSTITIETLIVNVPPPGKHYKLFLRINCPIVPAELTPRQGWWSRNELTVGVSCNNCGRHIRIFLNEDEERTTCDSCNGHAYARLVAVVHYSDIKLAKEKRIFGLAYASLHGIVPVENDVNINWDIRYVPTAPVPVNFVPTAPVPVNFVRCPFGVEANLPAPNQPIEAVTEAILIQLNLNFVEQMEEEE